MTLEVQERGNLCLRFVTRRESCLSSRPNEAGELSTGGGNVPCVHRTGGMSPDQGQRLDLDFVLCAFATGAPS